MDFIKNNSKTRFEKKAQYRVDKPDYSERAVTEALINALIHRDYLIMGAEIHINMYDDRLEITSPGGMYAGKPIQETNINEIESVRRNPTIADLFHRMKFMERRGSGLKKIIAETKKLAGYTDELKPQFHSKQVSFGVVLKSINYAIMLNESTSTGQDSEQDGGQDNNLKYKEKQNSKQDSEHDRVQDGEHDENVAKLIEFCKEPRTRDEMQTHIGIASRPYFTSHYLKPLLSSGNIKMTIPDKPKSKYQKYVYS